MKIYAKKKDQPKPDAIYGATWIPLTKGCFALVDDADANYINQSNWHVTTYGYAARTIRLPTGKQTEEKMHRVLLPCPAGIEIDHINRDRLDNRRSNMRHATHAQNQQNSFKANHKPLGNRGAYRTAQGNWTSRLEKDGKLICLGRFATEAEAAAAYKRAALEMHGDFSILKRATGG